MKHAWLYLLGFVIGAVAGGYAGYQARQRVEPVCVCQTEYVP